MNFFKKFIYIFFDWLGYSIIKKTKKTNFPRIEEITEFENNLLISCKKYTMTPDLRLWSVIVAYKHIIKNNIQGDFVECGIWKGGNIILLKKLLENQNLKRNVIGYDTFLGMPEPSAKDEKVLGKIKDAKSLFEIKNPKGWCYSSIEEVKENIKRTCNNMEGVKLIKGKVEDTLKENVPEKISLLRLDTDFYESTKIELEILYPKLEKGGILIIDDYGNWKGAKKAVDEYFKGVPPMIYIDHTCRYIVKM